MTELAFLGQCGVPAADVCARVAQAIAQGADVHIGGLLPPQIHKIVTTLKFLAGQPEGERAGILEGLGCPDSAAVAGVVKTYELILKTTEPTHDLRDFDWSTSVILGTSTISNIKEPICTLRFDIDSREKGRHVVKSRNVELTLDEAEQLLKQLQAARAAQRELL